MLRSQVPRLVSRGLRERLHIQDVSEVLSARYVQALLIC